ncbi:hypothetical protein BX600DRAFT_62953 [Xylariales sp. PMI_506]|nr:hypothetical protein BX600DRAFT_62953 [Xylariales sp. PMI_506]
MESPVVTQKVGPRDRRLSSKGCLACRRMKVKCDETKPSCQRCERVRRKCPGYRSDNVLFVHAIGSAKRENEPQRLAVRPPPAEDWIQSAIAHYFYHFVIPTRGHLPGRNDQLPGMYTANMDMSFFRHAVEAVSMASVCRAKHMSLERLIQTQRKYGKAVQDLALALDSKDVASSAVALMSATLLWEHDLIMGEDAYSRSPHRYGILQILQLRLAQQSPGDAWVNRSAIITLQLQQIGRDGDPKIPTPNVTMFSKGTNAQPSQAGFVETIPRLGTPAVGVMNLLPGVLVAYKTATALVGHQSQAALRSPEIKSCVDQLVDLNHQMIEWENALPDEWQYQTHLRPIIAGQAPSFPQKIISFHNVNVIAPWIAIWLCRLTVLACIEQLRPLSSIITMPAVRHALMAIVDQICSAVAALTETTTYNASRDESEKGPTPLVTCLWAIRVLYAAAQASDLPSYKRTWIFQQLELIGQEKGIGQALTAKEFLLESDRERTLATVFDYFQL